MIIVIVIVICQYSVTSVWKQGNIGNHHVLGYIKNELWTIKKKIKINVLVAHLMTQVVLVVCGV